MERTGRLGIQPLDNAVADDRLAALAQAARYGSMHMALPDGSVVSRGWAVAALSSWLPGLHWIGWLTAHVPGVAVVLDRAYGSVAGSRGRMAGFVPDVEPVERPGQA